MKYRAAHLGREVTSPSATREDWRGTGFYSPTAVRWYLMLT
jgi:hypothetical protein